MIIIGREKTCFTLGDLEKIFDEPRIFVDNKIYELLDKTRSIYEEHAKKREIYGYCTGLGNRWNIRKKCGPEWERKVIEEHKKGTGETAPVELVKFFMLVRIIQLSQGRAPVRGIILKRLVDAFNNKLYPVIPLYGSLGASGDLIPSAHLVDCLFFGQGKAMFNNDIIDCKNALEKIGVKELDLVPGEALALINNTAWSTGILLFTIIKTKKIIKNYLKLFREIIRLTKAVKEHYSPECGSSKKHPGIMRAIEGIGLKDFDEWEEHRLQDPYSLRCVPQIVGALLDLLDFVEKTAINELCSTSENPIVENKKIIHTCNFHATHIALASDSLSIGLAVFSNLVERQFNQLLRQEITGLPDFLAGDESPVGEMITHYNIVSILGRIRSLASPASIHNSPTSMLQEDIVPQAFNAAYKAYEITRLLETLVETEKVVLEKAKKLTKQY